MAPCFDEPSAGELVVDGRKLAGSAQWRIDGALLQHGSILVEDDQSTLAELVVGEQAPIPAPATLVDQVKDQALTEPDAELRGKLLTLKGMLDFKSGEFVDQLKAYTPPIIPPEPKKEPEGEKKEPQKKEPEKNP